MSGQNVLASTVTILGAGRSKKLTSISGAGNYVSLFQNTQMGSGAYTISGNRYGVQLATNFHLVLIFTFTGHVISMTNFSHHHGTA